MVLCENLFNNSEINQLFDKLLSNKQSQLKTINNSVYSDLEFELWILKKDYGLVLPKIDHHLKTMRLDERIKYCGSLADITIKCKECGIIHRTTDFEIHCFNRYSECCAGIRYKKAYSRLMNYDIKSDRLIHAVFGFPTKPQFYRKDKASHEFIISEFIRECKRKGIPFGGLKLFDFQDKDEEYIHYHAGLLPAKYDYRIVQGIVRKISAKHGSFVFHILGYRPKKALFGYFAKRIAGLYGDGNKYVEYVTGNGKTRRVYYAFTLSDIMDTDTYIDNFYNIRCLTTISRRLACNIVPVSEYSCPDCYSNLVKVEILVHYKFVTEKLTDLG